MPNRKSSITFIGGFLIPNLNSERFGNRLKWIDKEKKKFQIDWCHKGGPRWTEREAAVFVEWDKHKGHYRPEDKSYFTKSKQRFRALLYKFTNQGDIIAHTPDDKSIKIYSLGEQQVQEKKRRRRQSSSCDSSEYEYYEETVITTGDTNDSDDIYTRKVSEDNMINIQEDHAYIPVDSLLSSTSDSERDEVLTNMDYNPTPISFYDHPADLLNKVSVIDNCLYKPLENFSSNNTVSKTEDVVNVPANDGIYVSGEMLRNLFNPFAWVNCEAYGTPSHTIMCALNDNTMYNHDFGDFSCSDADLATEILDTDLPNFFMQ